LQTHLSHLPVLIIDCQATGSNPHTCSLIEIGWTTLRACDISVDSLPEINTFLVRLPENVEIPHNVSRITGISHDDLADATDIEDVWNALIDNAGNISAANDTFPCTAVIHFARFETPFLKRLHDEFAPHTAFPFHIICTHEIVKRLLPGLPRRGLRAVAGYFGHGTGEMRRAGHHVAATAIVWKYLLDMLENEHGICAPEELHQWLANTKGSSRTDKEYPLDRSIRLGLPDRPGVYRMLRSNGDVLYVGKAKSLKKRVNSYFTKRNGHSEHILEMLSQAADIDTTETCSALEAAVIEHDEIKRLSPPYNKALKNQDKTLWFSSRDFLSLTEKPDKQHPLGPFPQREPVEQLGYMFRIITEGISVPVDIEPSGILGIPPEYAPDYDCLAEGIRIFLERHRELIGSMKPESALGKLGIMFLAERLQADAADSEDADMRDDDDDRAVENTNNTVDHCWTPEEAANALEGVILRGTRLMRRARWYCRLSESSLIWSHKNKSESIRNLIVFSNGEFNRSSTVEGIPELPIIPGFSRTIIERQLSFDIAKYERMRVVTTELKRLIAEKREIELRFSADRVLTRTSLYRVLLWM